MRTLFLSILLSISFSQAAASLNWPWPAADSPFVDGMQSMLDSIRERDDGYDRNWNSPYNNRWSGRNSPNRSRRRSPFPRDDPWVESGIPFDELPESRFSAFITPPPSALLKGRWIGQAGDGMWIQNGWIRFYKGDDYQDAKIAIKRNVFYAGIPQTGRVMRFFYELRDDLLAVQDQYGRRYLYQKFEEKSSEEKSDSDDK